MIINDLLEQKNISMYKLSKLTDIPYTTINEMCNGKTSYKKCSAENIYKIAKVLNTTVEYLMEYQEEERVEFDLFKSQYCHLLKEMKDLDFMVYLLENNLILDYAKKKWWPECLYLLAMLDYLSRINDYPVVKEYDEFRKLKLSKPIYPSSVVVLDSLIKDRDIKKEAFNNSIPEFKRFNIVESEVRNVI